MTQTQFPDGVSEPTATPGDSKDESGGTPPVNQLGPLMDEPSEEKVVKGLRKLWDQKEPDMAPRLARWKANARRRAGAIGVHVIKSDPDRNEWRVWAPPGSARVPPTFNQAARLCRRLKSNLIVDKPIPECTPGSASDNSDPDAAEFATRVLLDVGSGAKHNTIKLATRAIDKMMTYDSGFVREYVDPKGGGNRPKAIKASQAATNVSNAVWIDEPNQVPQPGPFITRYVKKAVLPPVDGPEEGLNDIPADAEPDSAAPVEPVVADGGLGPSAGVADPELTDDPTEAELEWLPALRGEVFTGKHLRFIPDTATDIDDAEGVIMSCYKSLGYIRELVPEKIDALTPDELWALVGQRPGTTKDLLPNHLRNDAAKPNLSEDKAAPPPDESQVLLTWLYMQQGPTYPKGCYILGAGEKTLLHRQTWMATINGVEEPLEIPIAQFGGFEEGEDDPYKLGLMHFLGPGNEIRGAALGGAIEHLDRFNRRKVFYSPDTLFQPKSATAAMGTYIATAQGSKPQTEDVPEYPAVGMDILDRASAEMSDESGLQPIAQGQTDPTVQSGLHAQRIIEQVSVGLADIKQSTEEGFIRLWRIQLQLLRAFFTVPQLLKFRGDDQEYKLEEWTAADLGDTRDVRILPGSFTMLAPSAKMAVAEYMMTLGLIDAPQLKYLAGGNIGGLLGIQDDPALLRVRRQLNRYLKGPPKLPPEALQPPAAVPDIAPAPGVPLPPTPEEMAYQPILADIFAPTPNDADPEIAKTRWREMSRTLCGTKHGKFPKAWKAGLEQEYELTRVAAGMGTVADAQQQAATAAASAATAPAPGAQAAPGAPSAPAAPVMGPDGQPVATPLSGDVVPLPTSSGLVPGAQPGVATPLAAGAPAIPPMQINITPPPYGRKKVGVVTRDPTTGSSTIEITEAAG